MREGDVFQDQTDGVRAGTPQRGRKRILAVAALSGGAPHG